MRDNSVDVMLLCETWHDADSVSIARLRADGFSVIERARPRVSEMSLSINHGGVAIVAAAGVRMSAIDVGLQPTTFECVAARVTSSSSPQSVVVVVVYRPGSSTVTATFFSELTDLLDRLLTYVDPVLLAGDVNIRLERVTDPDAVEFNSLLAGYGLSQLVDPRRWRNAGCCLLWQRSELFQCAHH